MLQLKLTYMNKAKGPGSGTIIVSSELQRSQELAQNTTPNDFPEQLSMSETCTHLSHLCLPMKTRMGNRKTRGLRQGGIANAKT